MFYQRVRENWRNLSSELRLERLISWRRENSVVRVEKPMRLDRARSLGYRAKQGIFVVRVRVKRGGRKRERPTKAGRRSRRATSRKVVKMSYLWICEQRANRRYRNCEVLGSYPLLKDGRYFWGEVIMIDRNHPVVLNDPIFRNIARQRGRTFRGLTSQGEKSRGLRWKGKGSEKIRPSIRAHRERGK